MLRGTGWQFVTDVSGNPICPVFGSSKPRRTLNCLTLEDRLMGCPETSETNYQPMPRNIPEEQRPQLHRSGSLKPAAKLFGGLAPNHRPSFVRKLNSVP
jgi:hypothetical protein